MVPGASWPKPGAARTRARAASERVAFNLMICLLISGRRPAARAADGYSYLKASIGSSRDAFRAG